MADLSSLTPSQIHAVEQLRDLTNGGDDEVAIGVLSSVNWEVERAAEMIFDNQAGNGKPGPSRSSSRGGGHSEDSYGRRYEEFDIDDSEQGLLRNREPPRNSSSFLNLITYPLHLLSSLFRFIFGILRIPMPYIPFLSLNIYRTAAGAVRGRPRAGGGIERWIRELEEETGAVCAGSAGSADTTGIQINSSVDSPSEAGPSTLTSRNTSQVRPGSNKLLPPFQLGTYDSILRVCRSSFRIGCIILVSAEHDSTAEFKSKTLTDSELVRILVDEDAICWGGDIRDKEPYEAAMKLGATTYPFVAFVGMQPSRNFTSSSASRSTTASQSTPTLIVLSRHPGASACTPSALTAHLQDTLLPRVKPYLERTRTQKETQERQRAMERQLREAQDRAFEETKRRDKERILKKIEEERVEMERKKAEEERKRAEEERLELELLQAMILAEERERWRAWFRQALPAEPSSGEMIRIAVRMPDGRRLMRRFDARADTLNVLYAFVDTELVAASPSSSATSLLTSKDYSFESLRDVLASSASSTRKPDEWWGFVLVSAYPRQLIPWEADTLLGSIKALSGGQLVVEMVNTANGNGRNGGGKGKGKGKAREEEDEYETESSEEE